MWMILLTLLGVSLLASILIVAALMLSARIDRQEQDAESYERPSAKRADGYPGKESA